MLKNTSIPIRKDIKIFLISDEILGDLSPDCDIAGLREAINDLGHGTSEYHLFSDETNLDDLPDDTKLADHGFNDIIVEYPTAGAGRDVFDPPHPVIISSDQIRRIILPQRGIHSMMSQI